MGTLIAQSGAMVTPFLSYYLVHDRGVSIDTAGLILTVLGSGGIFSHLVGGFLTDRLGPRATFLCGMVVNGLALFLLGTSKNLTSIVIFSFLAGIASQIYKPASAVFVKDAASSNDRPRAYGLLYWAVNLGYAISMSAGGVLANLGYHLLFLINSAASILCGVLVWVMSRQFIDRHPRAAKNPSLTGALKDRLALYYMLSWLPYGIVFGQATTTLPMAMERAGLTVDSYGIVITANALVIIAVQPLLGPILARHDHNRVLILGMIVLGIGFGSNAFATSMVSYAGSVIIWTLGEIAVTSVNQSIIASLSPRGVEGTYFGLYGVVWSGTFALAPLIGSHLLSFGPDHLWIVCLLLCLGAAASQRVIAPAIRNRSAATTD
ncbi:MDR family MFS transporter [Streptomyces sp. LaBMicrA B280]|uniref:MDR family MFS transporter n=1 Tax=Streptomyces sp. LaBMicrA B280 TaxID=3391001 RepID=UPI003BA83414